MKSVLFSKLFFSIKFFSGLVCMVKLHFINQKACLINYNHETCDKNDMFRAV